MTLPIGAAGYYDVVPSADHEPGDLWSNLPTYGVLPQRSLPGLVITPSCDLANRKVETVTYLPAMPVSEYLTSRSLLPRILQKTDGQLSACGATFSASNPDGNTQPRHSDLSAGLDLLDELGRGPNMSAKKTTAASRARAGLRLSAAIVSGTGPPSIGDYRLLFGSDVTRDVIDVVRNSFRADIHFLPADEQPPEWSLIQVPSVALFRYPLSIPIDILDLAGSTSEAAWTSECDRLQEAYPCTATIRGRRPVKLLRIRPAFSTDLLARFTGLYGRIGSPDFTKAEVTEFVARIVGE